MLLIDILNLNQVGVMHNAVKAGFGNLTFGELVIPPHWCKLGADDGGGLMVDVLWWQAWMLNTEIFSSLVQQAMGRLMDKPPSMADFNGYTPSTHIKNCPKCMLIWYYICVL